MNTLIIDSNNSITTITLNRPKVHNAINDDMIKELNTALDIIHADALCRVVVINATGKCFCAGADLNWMGKMKRLSLEENYADAHELARMLQTLYHLNKPVIAKVEGPVYGGGVGLVSCCDMVIAADTTQFCLSEVKLGMTPAVISPYVINAMGVRAARRYFVTAESMNATTAKTLGLVHEVVPANSIDKTIDDYCQRLLQNSPDAIALAKELTTITGRGPIDQRMINAVTQRLAVERVSDHGQEGLTAFLQKRKPNWINE